MKIKKNKISTNILFLVLAGACLIIMMAIFTIWNKPAVVNYWHAENLTTEAPNVKYSIDSCRIDKGNLHIKGWLFPENQSNDGTLIITAKYSDNEIVIPSFTFERPDVSKIFNRNFMFDKIGFNAAINHFFIKTAEVPTFNFYSKNNNGTISKVLSYECKK
ncbi:hypothetical protein [Klebsiella oxytoca]|uniref:hypothetical protein n=1 Tax=Klebsiella oxytoca TaxID=571 RepID=UPI00157B18A8|nr:hypothetical protein [Klebsiella oxytoca]